MDLTNNRVSIVGQIVGNFEYSHEMYGEKFYTNHVKVDRLSSASDLIPIMVSDRAVDVKEDLSGKCVSIEGQFRSYNKKEGNRTRLILSVFADVFELEDFGFDINIISLIGYVCKEPIYRKTPLGREIADVLLAVNRSYEKSDYIPCITWGRDARYTSELPVGTKVKVIGRIQSREYHKKLADGTSEDEVRIAYEVSVGKIEEWEEEEE